MLKRGPSPAGNRAAGGKKRQLCSEQHPIGSSYVHARMRRACDACATRVGHLWEPIGHPARLTIEEVFLYPAQSFEGLSLVCFANQASVLSP